MKRDSQPKGLHLQPGKPKREIPEISLSGKEGNLLARIMETSPVGITVTNTDGKIIYANSRAEDILELSKDKITSRGYTLPKWKITNEDRVPIPEKELTIPRVLATGQPIYDFQYTVEWPDRRRKILSVNASPIFPADGSVENVVASLEDITSRIALKEKERWLQSFPESNPDPITEIDPTGKVIYANPTVIEIWPEMMTQGFNHPWLAGLENLFIQFKAGSIEKIQRQLKIDTRWFLQTVTFLPESGYIRLYGHNITQAKSTEESLQLSEQRYHRVYDHSPLTFLIWDKDFNILDWNKRAEEVFGWTREEVMGKNWVDVFIPPDDKGQLTTFGFDLLQKSTPRINFNRNITKDGRILLFEWHNSFLQNSAGETIAIISLGQDITNRVQSEEALRQSEERYRSLFEDSPLIVELLDANFNLIDWNPKAEEVFGWKKEEVLGQNILKLTIPAEEWSTVQQHLKLVLSDNTFAPSINQNITREGNVLICEWHNSILQNSEGQLIGIISFGLDITERVHSEESIQRQIKRLASLREIDSAINASPNLQTTLSLFLEQLVHLLQVDAADVMLFNPYEQTLEVASARGFWNKKSSKVKLRLGEGIAGRAAFNRTLMYIAKMDEVEYLKTNPLLDFEKFVSCYAIPLISKGEVKGVLEIFNRKPLETDQEWEDFLQTLAGQAAIAVDNSGLFEDLQRSNMELLRAYEATIEGWSRTLALRDKETEEHTSKTVELTLRMAQVFGVPTSQHIHIRRGALLHDIGKMGIPDNILLKPAQLTPEEWEIMRMHPLYAFDVLSKVDFLRPALDIPYCHHERWDGTGYPRGLRGEMIPLAARIFSVADVWQALCQDRPYRKRWQEEDALQYIKDNSGTQFDPAVVRTFLEILDNEGQTFYT